MIEKRVLHGDLSPNNFVVYDGIGYFIDFDHTSILAEGTTSTYSHGTGTMPYISIRILQAMLDLAPLEVDANIPGQDADPNNVDNFKVDNNVDLVPQATSALQNVDFDMDLIEHRPSDDLESLFYIFFEFVAKYGGPHGQLAPTWSRQTLPWASAYEALGNADTHLALSTICFAKMGVLMQGRFLKWGTMVYGANVPQNQVEMTHSGVLHLLDIFMRSIGEEPPPLGQLQSLHPSTAASQSLHSRTSASHALHTPPAGPSEPSPCRSARLSRSLADPPIPSTALSEPLSSRSPQKKNGRLGGGIEKVLESRHFPPCHSMPPKKRARRSYEVSEDQLRKAGETLVAPARKGRKETNLDISDAEENPMAPSQLRKLKKNDTTKRSLTGSSNLTQCSIGINKNVHPGRQRPNPGHQHSDASLRTAPSAAQSSGRFGFWQPTSTGSQNTRKAPRSNERTCEEEARNQAPEHGIGDDNDQDQDQDQTDGENEERDEVQDQEQTLETGDTMDFRQHKDDLDGMYEGEAQEDFDHEPDTVDDFLNQGIDGDFDDEPGTQRDEPDAQDSGIDDDFNNELNNAARDETEESVLIFVLRLILSHALQEAFDVLKHHQMKNGRCKAPS
ncbi:uncharacterized protein F5891DRAFT_1195664 [Suillus fuscotomentosus]|uniref:Fungal-type protein kinase domain-containing protein n=1 Tax=Suillus fuscotomentosus TaxID=1912939 RepID=A0AAD4HDZ3_9AGAM|nr:uncharacterized protein F5891DRAFT_1195664 [Suillus fuscotomentosus]KAG1894105.1 hypothetical protein F5891DRAFT_1195664 [Suillus fuscotomentosus]